jgi:hypothetical protein
MIKLLQLLLRRLLLMPMEVVAVFQTKDVKERRSKIVIKTKTKDGYLRKCDIPFLYK